RRLGPRGARGARVRAAAARRGRGARARQAARARPRLAATLASPGRRAARPRRPRRGGVRGRCTAGGRGVRRGRAAAGGGGRVAARRGAGGGAGRRARAGVAAHCRAASARGGGGAGGGGRAVTEGRNRSCTPPPQYSDFQLYRCVLRQARPYAWHIGGLLLLGLLSTPLALLTPLPLKIAVDHRLGSVPVPRWLAAVLPDAALRSDVSILVFAAALVVVVALLTQLQTAGTTLLRTYTGERLTLGFRSRLFHHVQRLSLTFHDTRGPGDPLYRIQYDVPAIQYIAIEGLISFITSTVTLVSILYITARLNWRLALVALVVSPLLVLLMKVSRRRLRSQSREVKHMESSALSVVQEVLASLRVVKAFGRERREEERFVDRSSEGMWARVRLSVLEGGLQVLIGLTTAVGTAAVLFIGARSVQAGTLTLGELLLVMGYLALIYEPLKTISKRIASLQSHLTSAERAFRLLDEAPDVTERPG